MNRADVVKLVAGFSLLAGCAPGMQIARTLPSSASGIAHGKSNRRTGVPFPQLRPDGQKPATSCRGYKPKRVVGHSSTRHASVIQNCTADGTCGGDGTGAGSNPDVAAYSGDYGCFAWNADNYSEYWKSNLRVLHERRRQ